MPRFKKLGTMRLAWRCAPLSALASQRRNLRCAPPRGLRAWVPRESLA